ncbi:MAG TPA: PAS domain S-box protein [Prolixibacteraceae bacterium]
MEKNIRSTAQTIRQMAEEQQKKNQTNPESTRSEADVLKLIFELEVHQIELEMQNEELKNAKNELERVSENYIELYDFAPSGYFTLSKEGRIMELNFCGARMLGKARSAIKNSKFSFFVSTDSRSEFDVFLEKAFNSIGKETCEVKLSIKGDVSIFVLLSGIATENGERCLVSVLDINDRKREEDFLVASETQYRSLFESAKEGIMILDAETGIVTAVNPFFIELLSSSADQFLDKAIWEIGLFKDTVTSQAQFIELQRQEYVHCDDLQIETAEGRQINIERVFNFYLLDRRKVMQCNIRDVTKRMKSELALRNSETHLRTLVQSIPDLIWLKDINGVYLSCNPIFGRFFGAREVDIVGKTDYDFVGKELSDFFRENDQKAMAAGKSTINEEWISFADDGHRVFLETIKTPMYDSAGMLLGVLGIGRDLTERKLAAQIVIASEKRFRAIFDQAPIAIALLDLEGHPIISNLSLSRILGYTDVELSKMKFTEFTYPEDIDRDMNQFKDLIDGKIGWYSMEKRYVHKNGNLIWANLYVTVLNNKKGLPHEVIGMIEDITERKLAEEEITILSHSLKSINECVSITDLENNILFVNESFLKTYGYELNELIGKNISIVSSPGNEIAHVNEILPATILGDWQGELLQRRKDGSEFPIHLSTTNIKDKESKVLGLVGVATEISERKHAEQELIKAKEHAEESDRLKSAFLANMSHEVRTPLNSIIGFSELLADADFDAYQKLEFIQNIIKSGNNLLTIISDVMDISKMESGEITIRKTSINTREFISGIKDQFAFQAEAKGIVLNLIAQDADEESIIFADSDRLSQIFNNLVGNAIKFTVKGHIDIGYRPCGNGVEFFVTDTGIGIPACYHTVIFDRFRQVEAEKTRTYGGNGLGLAITKNLVELMGGKIWLQSTPGKGSTFYFTLPGEDDPKA